ncbi:MAG: phosphoribosylformylglycinamidine synthase I [Nanoarchaeota archaeon]|nr:phosphoribosylformylglycinamidine synthase I [Nanoarchaeota archaeon]MBU1004848.1 phosphoribosylformylglycinamidine synthase I [Nanoarchaeota archaeon]MBU1946786.1 phosphoribosylformylglycinamidine synthase I [Nanoarchaeota archaeon]
MSKIAVILFPGINCENETARAIESVGMKADIVRWNDTRNLDSYDGYVLPGGWSYEDRIRAGVIAAKDPVMNIIKEEAEKGKVVMGICNGCQIIVESGIIPGLQDKVQMALAPNKNPFVSGFYCTWIKIKNFSKKKNAFNLKLNEGEVMNVPIAHGEGRFATKDETLVRYLLANDQLLFRYCDETGNIADKFPANPNGSLINIAGIVNKKGNVLAMMPHPERAAWMRQVPGMHSNGESAGPGRKIFESIREYLK